MAAIGGQRGELDEYGPEAGRGWPWSRKRGCRLGWDRVMETELKNVKRVAPKALWLQGYGQGGQGAGRPYHIL